MNFQYKTLPNVDLFAITELEKNCFDEQACWNKNMLKDSIVSPVTKFFGAFAKTDDVACQTLQIVGYCAVVDYDVEVELLRICVSPAFQHFGIGYGLLNYVIKTLKSQQKEGLSERNALPCDRKALGGNSLYRTCRRGSRGGMERPQHRSCRTLRISEFAWY